MPAKWLRLIQMAGTHSAKWMWLSKMAGTSSRYSVYKVNTWKEGLKNQIYTILKEPFFLLIWQNFGCFRVKKFIYVKISQTFYLKIIAFLQPLLFVKKTVFPATFYFVQPCNRRACFLCIDRQRFRGCLAMYISCSWLSSNIECCPRNGDREAS